MKVGGVAIRMEAFLPTPDQVPEVDPTDLKYRHTHLQHLGCRRVVLSCLDKHLECVLEVAALEVQPGEVDVTHL